MTKWLTMIIPTATVVLVGHPMTKWLTMIIPIAAVVLVVLAVAVAIADKPAP